MKSDTKHFTYNPKNKETPKVKPEDKKKDGSTGAKIGATAGFFATILPCFA